MGNKTKAVTVATQSDKGLNSLIYSCNKFDIDIEVLGMNTKWMGFGTKIILLKKYLEKLEGYSHFIFVDAYDTLFINTLDRIEFLYDRVYDDKLVFSTEKACWPDTNLTNKYPTSISPWKYLNSGGYMGRIDLFLDIVNKYPIKYENDDQLYFTKIYLDNLNIIEIKLDTPCYIFQSIAFKHPGDFKYNPVFANDITKTNPCIIHGNGKTPMDKIYNLIS